jgi:hypothetical protein
MRLIKMLGLSAVAAAAVMAFVGASSASATSLEEVVACKLDVTTCPAGEFYGSGTKVDGELVAGTHTTLLTPLGNVLCNESETEGELTSALAHGSITAVSFSNNGGKCPLKGTSAECEVTIEHLPYLVKVSLMSNHTGYEAVVSSGGGGAPKALVDCGAISLKCLFWATTLLFTVLLATNHTVWDIEQELERTGGSGYLCPPRPAIWDAEYLVRCLSPTGTYVNCWPAMEEGSVL